MRVLTLQEVACVAGGHNGETHEEPTLSKKADQLLRKFDGAKTSKQVGKALAKLEKFCAKTDERAVCAFVDGVLAG